MKKIILSSLMFTGLGYSAGYEQLQMFSGKYAGQASAVTSSVSGAEAIYFNPAGLFTDAKNDLSVNVSYINSKFRSPVLGNDSRDSKVGNNLTAAVLYSRQINEQWAWGVGVFPSAGLAIKYNDQDLGGGETGSPKVDLRLYEVSGGIAYKPAPEWTVGLAYRVTYSTADFTATPPPGGQIAEFKNMHGFDFLSARAGAQYKTERFGVGLNVRTPVRVNVKGKSTLHAGGGDFEDSSARIKTTFPLAVSLGGHYVINPQFTAMLDYTFLNYKATDKLSVDSTVATPGPGTALPDVTLDWKNAHVVRVGGLWNLASNAHLSLGYILVTAIVNKNHAMPTSEPPGVGHIITLGGGYALNEAVSLGGAVFYGFDSAHGNNVPGDYKVRGFGAHTGVDWKF